MYQLKTTISTLSDIREKKRVKEMWFPRFRKWTAKWLFNPRRLEYWSFGGGRGGAAGGENGRRAIERAHCITRRIKQDGSLSGPWRRFLNQTFEGRHQRFSHREATRANHPSATPGDEGSLLIWPSRSAVMGVLCANPSPSRVIMEHSGNGVTCFGDLESLRVGDVD